MARLARRFVVFALLACMAFAAAAQSSRPRVGLALGGGGARGGAHLGVLEVLEELRVPVDCIAGTSMGALVGGAYAAGVPPGEIVELVAATDWIAIFDDTAGRDLVNLRRKEIDDRFFSGLEFGVGRDGLLFREGAVAGEKLKLFFNQLVRAEQGDRPIEQLAIPLSIIATDIGNGERVAIRTGNLSSAMRASMSVPGLITPLIRDGRKLVDGGLTDNLPIAEARALCADVVIAVNVGTPLLDAEKVSGFFSVMTQVVNLLAEQNVAKSVTLLTTRDVYLRPDLRAIGPTEFTRQLEARERGRDAALAAAADLRRLALPPAEYARWRDRVRVAKPPSPPVVDQVQISSTRFVSPHKIRRGVRQREGEPLDARRLTEDLVVEYSQGDLQTLDYSVVRERDRTILRITPIEKPWGPNYLRFGMNLATDFRGESTYNLRALYRQTWFNPFGGEWLVATQIGSEQSLATEFYQPLDHRQRLFVRPHASTSLHKGGLYFGGDRIAVYRFQENRIGLDGGVNMDVYGQARLGWVQRRLSSVVDTGPADFANVTEEVGGPAATLAIDTYDQPFFPTRGVKLDLAHFDARHVSGSVPRYARTEARLGGAYSAGPFVLLGALEGGHSRGTLPLADAFTLGGPRRLSGFAPAQMRGGEYAFARVETQYRLTFPIPVFGLSFIGGVVAEAGRMHKRLSETALGGWQHSAGVYLAASTALGPIYIGWAHAKHGEGRFYLFLGSP